MAITKEFLINETDFRNFALIATGIEHADLDVAINQAQYHDLRPFLGDALYFDFIGKVLGGSPPAGYLDLLNGVSYTNADGDTVEFQGLKPMLVYYAFAHLITMNVRQTRFGARIKSSNQSEPADGVQIREQKLEARSTATQYQREAKKYIDENPDLYPLFDKTRPVNAVHRAGFHITKA